MKMFNQFYIVFMFLQYFVAVLGYTKPESPCKADDVKCLTNVGREVVKASIVGVKERGIQSLEPLLQELIEGKLATIKYTLKDCTVIGFKDIIVKEMKRVPPNTLRLDILFPHYETTGDYVIEGNLLNIPIEGKGKLFVNATNYQVIIDGTKEYYEKDGKKHLKIAELKVKSELLGTMYVDFENLFNGNKELAEPILKLINGNSKVVADFLGPPLVMANMKKLIKNINKILAYIPSEELIE